MTEQKSEQKDMLRKAALTARGALGEDDVAAKSRVVCERIINHESFAGADVILAYHPFANELDVSFVCEIALKLGKTVAFPVCGSEGSMVAAVALTDDTKRSAFGVLEPVLEASRVIEPERFGLIIAPCVAFDASLMRIGWGKGYYDRYLPMCVNAVHMAAAFSAQLVPPIPFEPWDRPMHIVMTESTIYRDPSINGGW